MPRDGCLVCGAPALARGLCSKHYRRYRVEGSPDLADWLPTADVMPRPPRGGPRPPRRCLVCGGEFIPGRSTQVICLAPACVAQRKRDIAREIKAGRPPRGEVDRVCVVCDSPFPGHPNSLVCGRECREARIRELARRREGSMQPRCIVCGALLPFQGGTTFTCPGECRDIARKRRSRRVYVANPGRRERMVEARRARKQADADYAGRVADQDRRRRRERARQEFEVGASILAARLAHTNQEKSDDSADRDRD